MTHASGTIEHKSWKEELYYEFGGQKTNRGEIECIFGGDLEAEAKTLFHLHYPDDKTAHYHGYVWVDGKLAGKKGTFVLFETGGWADGVARSNWEIVSGSGTGELKGITGSGNYAAKHDKSMRYSLDYDLPA